MNSDEEYVAAVTNFMKFGKVRRDKRDLDKTRSVLPSRF